MGFKKSKAFETIRVPMKVKTASEDGLTIEEVSVAHTFRIPSPSIREEYQRKLVKVKGAKIAQGSKSAASWYLWKRCVVKVDGYDDIGELDTEGNWMRYFSDDIGRIHVENAVDMLLEVLSAEEDDQEKKSEPSSEE